MAPHVLLAVAGGLVECLGGGWYIYSIFRGETRPSCWTWGVVSLIMLLATWSAFDGGASFGVLVSLEFLIVAIISFVLAAWPPALWPHWDFGKPGRMRYDPYLALIAVVAIITWKVVDFSPAIATTIAISADFLAVSMLIRDGLRMPDYEDVRPWLIGTLAAGLGMLGLTTLTYAAAAYPIYLFVTNFAIVASLWLGNRRLVLADS
jgi:hypothetical protein